MFLGTFLKVNDKFVLPHMVCSRISSTVGLCVFFHSRLQILEVGTRLLKLDRLEMVTSEHLKNFSGASGIGLKICLKSFNIFRAVRDSRKQVIPLILPLYVPTGNSGRGATNPHGTFRCGPVCS